MPPGPQQAVIYTRHSPRRDSLGCESCETQLEYCRLHCERNGWEIIGEFAEPGVSARSADDRPQLQLAMRMACRRKATLVVWSLSRFARNTRDAIVLIERLNDARANWCSVSEGLDTNTPMGRVIYKIMAVIAEFEREMINERTSSAMLRHQRNGRQMSRWCPFGWKPGKIETRLDPRSGERKKMRMMVPDPEQQETIRMIMEARNRGMGIRQVAKMLDEMGRKPARAEKWHQQQIAEIERRERRFEVQEGKPGY